MDVVGIDNDMRELLLRRRGVHALEHRPARGDARRASTRASSTCATPRASRGSSPATGADIALVVHAAAQPSHDWAAREPLTDFSSTPPARSTCSRPPAPRARRRPSSSSPPTRSTATRPNELPLVETDDPLGARPRPPLRRARHRRDDAHRPEQAQPVRRQQAGRRRAGAGVRTLLRHAHRRLPRRLPHRPPALGRRAARLPGLPGALRGDRARPYTIFGYKGKQVRDNIHSHDLVTALWRFHQDPRPGAVYNIGGSRHSNCSVLEAIALIEEITGQRDRLHAQRREPLRRPHLVDQRRAPLPGRLPRLGVRLRPARDAGGDRRGRAGRFERAR